MKNILIIFAAALVLLSCGSKPKDVDPLIELKAKQKTDSTIRQIGIDRVMTEYGMEGCPIQVISAETKEKQYSAHRNILLEYKNTSKKDIDAIKFEWYVTDAFGDPASLRQSYPEDGTGSGFVDTPLKAGETTTSYWDLSCENAKKVVKARAFEVAFSDGTKWEKKIKTE